MQGPPLVLAAAENEVAARPVPAGRGQPGRKA